MKFKFLQQKVIRKDKKMKSVKDILNVFKKYLLSTKYTAVIKSQYSGKTHEILKMLFVSKLKGKRYNEKIQFALTFKSYSPRARTYCQEMFIFDSLPINENCDAGYLLEVLQKTPLKVQN